MTKSMVLKCIPIFFFHFYSSLFRGSKHSIIWMDIRTLSNKLLLFNQNIYESKDVDFFF